MLRQRIGSRRLTMTCPHHLPHHRRRALPVIGGMAAGAYLPRRAKHRRHGLLICSIFSRESPLEDTRPAFSAACILSPNQLRSHGAKLLATHLYTHSHADMAGALHARASAPGSGHRMVNRAAAWRNVRGGAALRRGQYARGDLRIASARLKGGSLHGDDTIGQLRLISSGVTLAGRYRRRAAKISRGSGLRVAAWRALHGAYS